jgi:hypothetical protein
LDDAAWQPLIEPIDNMLAVVTPGLSLRDVEQVTYYFYQPDEFRGRTDGRVRAVFRVRPTVDLNRVINRPSPGYDGVDATGKIHFRQVQPMAAIPGNRPEGAATPAVPTMDGREAYTIIGIDTLIHDTLGELQQLIANPPPARIVEGPAAGQVYFYADSVMVKTAFIGLNRSQRGTYAPFMPLVDDTREFVGTADVRNPVTARVTARSLTPQSRENIGKTMEALITLGNNFLQQYQQSLWQDRSVAQAERAQLERWVRLGRELLANARFERPGDNDVTLHASAPIDLAAALQGLLPAVQSARAAAFRSQSQNNLRQIALAMLIYESANKSFPPAIVLGPDGRTPHSWRVAILPYLGYEALYERYRLDEPWDSEHNRALIKEVPAVYRHPEDDPASTNTSYFVLTGPETVFAGEALKTGTRLGQISDGTAFTFLAFEAKRNIPWTKPEDIPYAAEQPLPKLGWSADDFAAVRCDGSVWFNHIPLNERDARAMITKAGRETIPARGPSE